MLKLVHDATATAVDDPEALTIEPRRAVPGGRPGDAGGGAAGRAPGLPRGPRRRARRHRETPGGRQRLRPDPGGDDRGGDGRGAAAPRVDDRREGERFSSAILPAYMRKSPEGHRGVADPVPARALDRGLRTRRSVSSSAPTAGLSASTVNRLTEAWQAEHDEWSRARPLGARLRLLAGSTASTSTSASKRTGSAASSSSGVRPDGTKELVALADGYRESTESWAEVLRSAARPWAGRPGARRRRRGARVLGRPA